MADDAFALSPISARASLPSEADYGAIRDAFMETARGRWFLDEYAKRNRNADTGMVLDAVARLEAGIAARAPASPSPEQVLAAIRPLIAESRAAADAAMASHDVSDRIAAGRRGTRIIREISWSLRETGTDPRICNILDQQLLALDSVHDHADADARRDLIGEVFDDLALRIEDIASAIGGTSPPTSESKPEPVESVGANMAFAEPDTDVTAAREAAMADERMAASPAEAATPVEAVSPLEDATDDVPFTPSDDEIAADEAVLDLIAEEMSAPEIDDVDGFDDDDAIAELQSLAAGAAPSMAIMPAPAAALATETRPPSDPSLGAALIASGIVTKPRKVSAALAPFLRMSQIEKIAFFS